MTNSEETTHGNCLARCSPHVLGFSREQFTGQTPFKNSQAATHVSQQEQSIHICNPRPPLFCISKESLPIPNSLEAHTSYTFPLPQFPLFYKRELTSSTHNFVISPIVCTNQFCDKNREIKLANPGKRTGTSTAGVLRPNHHASKGNC